MKSSRFGDKVDVSHFKDNKIKKLSNKDLSDVIDKFETSIKSRTDEAIYFQTTRKGNANDARGHATRIGMEKDYLQKLQNEAVRRKK